LPCHSFAPATPVLMADGTSKPIVAVAVGEKVATTDPDTGQVGAQTVTALHRNQDLDLTDVTISSTTAGTVSAAGSTVAAAGSTGAAAGGTVVHTTSHHPFWSETRHTWVDAAALQPGERLHTTGPAPVTVTAVRSFTGHQTMADLTVDATHTYYVIAGDVPVLVHNCDPAQIAARHGGEATEQGFQFPTRRAARQAASEMVGDMGSATRAIRANEFRGGPYWMRNSNMKIGRESLDGAPRLP
jgi:hypothetical protein